MTRDSFLVGSIPLNRSYEVFRTVADILGESVRRVPDGETGDRNMWIQAQYPVLVDCPQLQVAEKFKGTLDRTTSYQLRLAHRPGVRPEDVTFGELGYARYAKASFAVFSALQDSGRIPKPWRFQVSLPSPFAVIGSMVVPESRAVVEGAYERAMLAEVDKMVAAIPHDRLAISWDVAPEMIMWEYPTQHFTTAHFADMKDGVLTRLARIGERVPIDVEMGYHLCYGDQDHKHSREPKDAAAMTELATLLSERVKRRLDFIHMPVPKWVDRPFFEPLRDLKIRQETSLYLGLVHFTDGLTGTKRRIDFASKFIGSFGVATECGFGRRPVETVPELLRLHTQCAN
jgi:hypothetical protein